MPRKAAVAMLVALAALFASRGARADESVIRQPGRHPDYSFEAEPHVFFGFNPPSGRRSGWGPGFRGTIEIIDNGFIKSINNTVGLGFGFDWIAFNNDKSVFWVPIVMQWNFWLSRNWSVFGEPGWGFYLGNVSTTSRFAAYGGGRFHFSDTVALTLRVGYPAISAGLSFVF